MKPAEMLQKLQQMYPKYPSDDALKGYLRSLKRYNLNSDQLNMLFDHIVDNCHYFPTLSEIADSIAIIRKGSQRKVNWVKFELGGAVYWKKCSDPAHPSIPEKAKLLGVVVDQPYGYEPCSVEEGWEEFKRGYLEAGGNPESLAKYRQSLKAQSEPKSHIQPLPDLGSPVSVALESKRPGPIDETEPLADDEVPF